MGPDSDVYNAHTHKATVLTSQQAETSVVVAHRRTSHTAYYVTDPDQCSGYCRFDSRTNTDYYN